MAQSSYRCNSCGHFYGDRRSFTRHFEYSEQCRRVKPRTSILPQPSYGISPLAANPLPVHPGPLSSLAQRPPRNTSSATGSTFLNDDLPFSANNNSLVDADFALHTPTEGFVAHTHGLDSSYVDDLCDSTLPIELDPDFLIVGARLELGEESDSVVSSEDDDAESHISVASANRDDFSAGLSIFSGFHPQLLPNDAYTIHPSRLQPADEALLSLIIENNLPQEMYNKVLDWAHFAQISNYTIPLAFDYRTARRGLHAKYADVCGGPPPLSEIVSVPGYQPMHVYRFDFLQQAKRLYLNADLMNDCLWDYDPKEVFGHVAQAHSKVGLKKIKFHASKHCVFYIKRYGSSENTFGGSLESALKSTVKEPTKRTSRRHDHLCKELAARQHDRFCISQSRYENRQILQDFRTRTTPAPKSQRVDCDPTDESTASNLPEGWTMQRPVFSLSKTGDDWSTHRGKMTFDKQVVYPNFVSASVGDVFESGEATWVNCAVQKADKLDFTHVEVFGGATIPSERLDKNGKTSSDMFRCHPSFHSYPYLRRSWHDWAMVKWSYAGVEDSELRVAARLLLFAKLSQHSSIIGSPARFVAVIQSLSGGEPKHDSLLKFALGDTIERNPIVVDIDTIAETAFVLPCVENNTDDFPVDIDSANYFLVMPPRAEWKNIGWD